MVSENKMEMAAENRRIYRARAGSGALTKRLLSKCMARGISGVRTPYRRNRWEASNSALCSETRALQPMM
jgi:hypothetical protein